MKLKIKFVLLLSLLLLSLKVFSSEEKGDSAKAVDSVVDLLKQSIKGWNSIEFIELAKRHYIRLHLMDKNGKWLSPELEKVSEKLLPSKISENDVVTLIEKMAFSAQENPYLVNFIGKAKELKLDTLKGKVKSEGQYLLPSVTILSFIMNNLTRVELDHPEVLESVNKLFKKARVDENISFWDLGLFRWAKLTTVEAPVEQFINFRKTGKVDPNFIKYYLPINIIEAIIADIVLGHNDNAMAAWPLVLNSPADTSCDKRLGGGLATWSEDMRSVLLKMSLPKKWADLYAVWNLAFMSQFETAPFAVVKLLIPEVNDYKDRPEEYISRRALALYTYLHFSVLGEAFDKKFAGKEFNWKPDAEFSKLFGMENRKSASEYSKDVYNTAPSWSTWLKHLLTFGYY